SLLMLQAITPLTMGQQQNDPNRKITLRNNSVLNATPQLQNANNSQLNNAGQQIHTQSFSISDIGDAIVDGIKGAVNAVGSLFEGGNVLAGILAVGSQLIIPIPGIADKGVYVFIAGAVAGKLLIKQRHMTPEERAFAEKVFGNSLPSNDKII